VSEFGTRVAKPRSPRNKTLTLQPDERERYESQLQSSKDSIIDQVLNADLFSVLKTLPKAFADLIIIDPPYNMDKAFHGNTFHSLSTDAYTEYLESWLPGVLACAKPDASVYICGDWKSSASIFTVLEKHCLVKNRITWQREKGRGAAQNWKNCSEDIWFATLGKTFYFKADAVKSKKKVIAPYMENGEPKDWQVTEDGKFRLTFPSNFWDDITVPYWSMSENTDHPTQKPEKLLAKLILASSKPGDLVFDPFSGSGSTAVTAKKLERHFFCIEQNIDYCLWTLKRLESAHTDRRIQGYIDGVFLDRNST